MYCIWFLILIITISNFNNTSERPSSTRLNLNVSTKRNAWWSSLNTLHWRATNTEECDVVWQNLYFCFHARFASILLKPWCITIESGVTTLSSVDSSEPSEVVKEWDKKRCTQNTVLSRFMKSKSNFTQLHWF